MKVVYVKRWNWKFEPLLSCISDDEDDDEEEEEEENPYASNGRPFADDDDDDIAAMLAAEEAKVISQWYRYRTVKNLFLDKVPLGSMFTRHELVLKN